MAVLSKLLQKAQERTGDERTAAVNKQGHQKTPAFIHALLLDALEVVEKEIDLKDEVEIENPHPPRCGFTDVGLHTGGKYRDTSWHLVQESFKVIKFNLVRSTLLICFSRLIPYVFIILTEWVYALR